MTIDPHILPTRPRGGWKKLDPAFKSKWLEALRSGKYRQTNGTLRLTTPGGNHRFCCLGVACNIVSNRRWKPVGWTANTHGDMYCGWDDHDSSEINSLPFLEDPDTLQALVQLNDDCQASFLDIADWIEKNL